MVSVWLNDGSTVVANKTTISELTVSCTSGSVACNLFLKPDNNSISNLPSMRSKEVQRDEFVAHNHLV